MDRKAELEQLLQDSGWRAIARIAQSMDPPIEKPDGGWDEAIPLIVEAEQQRKDPEVKPPSEPVKPKPPAATKSDDAESKARIGYYKANGIPYCETCGYSLRTGLDGKPKCPASKTDCSRLEN